MQIQFSSFFFFFFPSFKEIEKTQAPLSGNVGNEKPHVRKLHGAGCVARPHAGARHRVPVGHFSHPSPVDSFQEATKCDKQE